MIEILVNSEPRKLTFSECQAMPVGSVVRIDAIYNEDPQETAELGDLLMMTDSGNFVNLRDATMWGTELHWYEMSLVSLKVTFKTA